MIRTPEMIPKNLDSGDEIESPANRGLDSANLLLVTVQPTTLLALVRRDLPALALFSTGHVQNLLVKGGLVGG